MRFLSYDVCPLWEEPCGDRTVGFYPRSLHPPVVGWVVVCVLELDGEEYHLLLNMAELADEG